MKDFLNKLTFVSSTIKGYNSANDRVAVVITMPNNVKIGIINLTFSVSASNGYNRVSFVGIPQEMHPPKNILINGTVNTTAILAYYQASSGSFVISYTSAVSENTEVSLFGTYLISGK